MTKEEFVTKATNCTTKEDFENLYEEVTTVSRAQKMTKNGATILKFLQTMENEDLSAKAIGAALEISSRSVSGAMRKLVTDGYVEKVGMNPTTYKITVEGMSYAFDN